MNPRTVLLSLAAALVAMFALAVPAGAAPGALKILNYSSCDLGLGYFTNFVNQVKAESGVAQVDDVDGPVPTPETLAQYDGVIVSSYCPFDPGENVVLGDRIADYQDAGGAVFAMAWVAWDPGTNADYAILGRWGNTMSPFAPTMTNPYSEDHVIPVSSTHPILAGITELKSDYVYFTQLASGATSLIDFEPGKSAVAVKGRAVIVNAVAAESYIDVDSQYGKLAANTVKVLGKQNVVVTKSGKGKGTVTGSVGGINCGALCNAIVNSGSAVTLTAKASKGSAFAGWTGSCSGNKTVCTANAAYPGIAATANFASVKLKYGKLKGKKLAVTLPGSGKLKISGSGLKVVSKSSKKAGKVTLKLKLKSSLKKKIAKNGKAKVMIKFAYTPTGAAKASSSSKSFTVK